MQNYEDWNLDTAFYQYDNPDEIDLIEKTLNEIEQLDELKAREPKDFHKVQEQCQIINNPSIYANLQSAQNLIQKAKELKKS